MKDFFSKCDQIRRKQLIWSHLLRKFFTERFIFLCRRFANSTPHFVDVTHVFRTRNWKMADITVIEVIPANLEISADFVNNGKSMNLFTTFRSSRPEMFLKILQNSQENFSARASFIKKGTLAQVLCEFCEIFNNTFFYRAPPVAASAPWYYRWYFNKVWRWENETRYHSLDNHKVLRLLNYIMI